MGVLGEMFPSRKLRSEAGEAGSGQGWRVNPETGLIEVFPLEPGFDAAPAAASGRDEPPAPPPSPPSPPAPAS